MKHNDRMTVVLAILVALALVIMLTGRAHADGLEIETSATFGINNESECLYTTLHLGVSMWCFTVYGSVRTDVQRLDDTYARFSPMRSIYNTGAKFNYKFIELGWFHQCTHRGDYATDQQWYAMRKPNQTDIYVKLSWKR